jgi:tRNA G46 methylase TrmB
MSAVITNQCGMHPRLADAVRKHLAARDQTPVPAHTQRAIERVARLVAAAPRPLILDSGCGDGSSALALAAQFPGRWVIGVDRSALRLGARIDDENVGARGGAILVRAELASFWRLAADAGWRLQSHWLLYPNPWPKSVQYLRRWHAHPALANLLRLGGWFELRSNWRNYVDEFARALEIVGISTQISALSTNPESALTPFERKYAARSEPLWRLTAQLSHEPGARSLVVNSCDGAFAGAT